MREAVTEDAPYWRKGSRRLSGKAHEAEGGDGGPETNHRKEHSRNVHLLSIKALTRRSRSESWMPRFLSVITQAKSTWRFR